ncbi:chitin deacetylase [Aspergillus ruber CBS 135680]|uniref:Polysaccharide deacetylase family protein n=1 Tax=Aspergillus ruber (strain CBS 135680) TaxID=1388766 RepID=A0A017SSG1_ASPRC|nr:polysaccharide deacetylase family protein [Aspergillus ruber CBS 135680]EYE99922.1 polysaccharide deacetylase family protein [Aspergillus ruber CBS 135680]
MVSLRYLPTYAYALFTASISTAAPAPIVSQRATANTAVAVGAVIDRCTTPGTIALTFDDGPYQYTADLLDVLYQNGAPATFFLNGQNIGSIYDYADVIQRMHSEGHQIASHTWSHPYLTSLDYNGVVSQMTQLEDALQNIVGVKPAYMRPPYLATNDVALGALGDLGYHVISCSIDTKDYENDDPSLIANSVNKFNGELNAGGSIVLSHDVHEQTVYTLAQAMLDEINARGLTPVTVAECLGDSNGWYQ